ncbi:MAG TPA: glutamate--tRNA ligase [Pseudomonadales bacterium]
MSQVRTRIAPSPTGDPHVGTAYIALFNLCFARQHNGKFILRIEDTDQQRSSLASEQAIFDSLRWLGLDWDEGPDVGGDFGPYRQSERSSIYRDYCQQLVDKGHAFLCYRSPAELEALRESRKAQGLHSALKPSDLALPADEIERRRQANAPYVIRMNVPESGECVVQDLLRGDIVLDWAQVDAQILMKSDGMPTYHLANVVDDHLMQITHVLRGEEWINSAPKHMLLYQYFGWQMPVLCHLPLLRNPDKSKLSKRKNPTSIEYYRRMGFMPEAVINYLGRMGWSMPDESEKFTLQQMLEAFDIQRVSLGGPVFDVEKLKWLNGRWLREELDHQALADRLQAWAFSRERLLELLPHFQQRIEVFSDLAPAAGFLFSGQLALQEADFVHACELPLDQQKQILQLGLWQLEALRDWRKDAIFQALKTVAAHMDIKIKPFLAPVFVAIAGSTASISVMDAMQLLGPDMSRARLRAALDVLGGVSKKQLKALEKQFAALAVAVD